MSACRMVVWLLVSLWSGVVAAAELRDVRLWASPDGTRVVFDLSGAAHHNVFALQNPDRIVVDLEQVDPAGVRVANAATGKGLVQRVRSAARGDTGVRVVLDLTQPVDPRSFALAPNDQYGHRVVLDLDRPVATQLPSTPGPLPSPQMTLDDKPVIVAVDAGHGGEDPGARGRSGVYEKDVAMAMARRLARMIDAEPGMRAVLTRDGDYYLGLRQRVEIARKHQADLFVSVHANAFRDPKLRGSAVYVLSNRGATSEHARWLAQRENAADLVGGIEIADKDGDLASVLIDLSQSATMEASFDVGSRILKSMGQVNTLQKSAVQQAGFMVLKAPDIPSVLVETAFITNSEEERMLRDEKHQERFARSMLAGIKGYFASYRPQQQIVRGELQQVSYRE
ncbi:N-acetylmuramoyl-L-alanine amidase [Flagellatimonas centrodinii]|uniref:N-acetylmuramoyl-L-alanine amidase n=1 Tax=Flagellatimonas centrodinii TaxID=2806210 RepID=UPI001FEE9377|nr:N-acetylmuramoyl-L-alanine amidase [Flagellatimonas centrodinii]ULQ45744.1 N-acetylmuramoyl-L-alanine amidase [Flagellatimonas centrodinii]